MPKWEPKPWSIANCVLEFVYMYSLLLLWLFFFRVCGFCFSRLFCFKIENRTNERWRRNGRSVWVSEWERKRTRENKKSWKYTYFVVCACVWFDDSWNSEAACCLARSLACLLSTCICQIKDDFYLNRGSQCQHLCIYVCLCVLLTTSAYGFVNSIQQNETVCVCESALCSLCVCECVYKQTNEHMPIENGS